MKLEIDNKRQAILDHPGGHLLVCGGPGSGKTTIALLKAKQRCVGLKPGQEVLFLSFSRAAVRQIAERCKSILTLEERKLIDIRTYHAFCMEVLRSHGRLLGGRTCRFVLPADERVQQSMFTGDWNIECSRRAREDSVFCFDLFASGTSMLFERSNAVRSLYGAKYPLVIVDEFQDTDDDQWRVVCMLAKVAEVFCLADPEQRIFEYRTNIDPQRMEALRKIIGPSEHNLGSDNHRSPEGGILDFADCVLYNRAPLPATENVKRVSYYPNNFDTVFHLSVVWTFSELRKRRIDNPCVAVLCRSNLFLSRLSLILSKPRIYKDRQVNALQHDIAWDAPMSAAAAAVIGSIMEWMGQHNTKFVSNTLDLIVGYYRLKNAEKPSHAAAEKVRKFAQSAAAVRTGTEPRIKAAKELLMVFRSGIKMIGDPVLDWKHARSLLEQVEDLNEICRDARMVRLFGARDALATGLGALWLSSSVYAGASSVVKRILDHEQLMASDRAPRGCVLMTIHKSKGKEFDAVVLVEGAHSSPFFDQLHERAPFEKSRRLLRVGLTRAKSMVTIVRPANSYSLVSPK